MENDLKLSQKIAKLWPNIATSIAEIYTYLYKTCNQSRFPRELPICCMLGTYSPSDRYRLFKKYSVILFMSLW